MEAFQNSLSIIREKEYERKKQLEFNQWQIDYKDHLTELYHIMCRYYHVDYNEFVCATYKTTKINRNLIPKRLN